MHPVVRMSNLLVTVAWLPFLASPALFACSAAGIALVLTLDGDIRGAVMTGVWRLRWLALAIVGLYLLFPAGDETLPTLFMEASSRVMVLCLAVLAVQLALFGVPPAALVDGLTRILAPLGRVGLASGMFARRLMLTLSAVPVVQDMAARSRHTDGLAARAATLIEMIEQDPPELADIVQVDTGPVPTVQWLWPTALMVTGTALLVLGGTR